MSIKKYIEKSIAEASPKPKHIHISHAECERLRKELGLKPGEPVVVAGVHVGNVPKKAVKKKKSVLKKIVEKVKK